MTSHDLDESRVLERVARALEAIAKNTDMLIIMNRSQQLIAARMKREEAKE
jgi:hypothetical protein